MSDSSVLELTKKRELAEFILEEFKEDAVYMYHSELEVSFAACNKLLSEERVSWLFSSGVIPPSDVFIVYAVGVLGFAAPHMVCQFLKILRNNEPEKIIPCVDDVNSVKERLRVCCSKGMLMCQSYKDPVNNARYDLYFTSHVGFLMVRNLLGRQVYLNDMLSTLAVVEKMARVASISVALNLYHGLHGCEEFYGYGYENTFREEKVTPILYSGLVRKIEDVVQHIIIEPLYFSIDERLDDMDARIVRYRNRLKRLQQWAGKITTLGETVKLIIVCENMSGVRRAFQLIENEMLAMDVCYTSERVMRQMSRRKLSSEAFLAIRYKNGEPSVVPVSLNDV